MLIKTDNNDFGRTIQLSFVKKDDCEMLFNVYNDYEKEVVHNEEVEEEEDIKCVSCVDELLKYADLYERGLLTLEEFESKKRELL